jgi:hypothetical protein
MLLSPSTRLAFTGRTRRSQLQSQGCAPRFRVRLAKRHTTDRALFCGLQISPILPPFFAFPELPNYSALVETCRRCELKRCRCTLQKHPLGAKVYRKAHRFHCFNIWSFVQAETDTETMISVAIEDRSLSELSSQPVVPPASVPYLGYLHIV